MRYERRKYTSELFEIVVAIDDGWIIAAWLYIGSTVIGAPGTNSWLCGELREQGETDG